MHRIFVSIFGETKNELLAMIENSRNFTNNFELRFDLCGDWKFKEKNLRKIFPKNATIIFTDKMSDSADEKRLRNSLISREKNNFELIDFDLKNLSPDLVRDKNMFELDFLISAHLFEKFSREKTKETINKLLQIPAKFYKLAVNLDTWEDLQEFISLSKNLEQGKWILAGMGKFGKISRVIFAKLGFATFAGIKNREVASGQIDIETLNNLLS